MRRKPPPKTCSLSLLTDNNPPLYAVSHQANTVGAESAMATLMSIMMANMRLRIEGAENQQNNDGNYNNNNNWYGPDGRRVVTTTTIREDMAAVDGCGCSAGRGGRTSGFRQMSEYVAGHVETAPTPALMDGHENAATVQNM